MLTKIEQTINFSVPASEIYMAYLDENLHSVITNSEALINAKKGGRMNAYDGYISGKFLELIQDKFIKQTWKAQEDKWGNADFSVLTLIFEGDNKSCSVKMIHEGFPPEFKESFEDGWNKQYWNLFLDFFNQD